MGRGWSRVLGVVVAAGLAAVAPAPAGGAPGPDPLPAADETETLPELHEHLDEAVAEEASLLIAYEQATARRAELDRQVEELAAELRATERDLAAAEEAAERAEAAWRAANRRLDQVTAQLLLARDRLRRQAVAAYTGGGDEDLSLAVLTAQDVGELGSGMVYAEVVVAHQHDLVEAVEALRAEADRLAGAAEDARDEADRRHEEVADRKAALEQARRHLEDAREQARAEEARQQELLRQVQDQRADYERRIRELEARNAAIAALLREYQAAIEAQREAEAAAAAAAAFDREGGLLWPLPGATVTSGYGYRIHPIYNYRRLHTGLDMGGRMGEEILAAAPGVVVLASVNGGYGNCVVVYHGGGMSTLYGHQSRIAVDVGDEVDAGQVVGYVGSTGVSTGPHLHFEVRIDGDPVNPNPYL